MTIKNVLEMAFAQMVDVFVSRIIQDNTVKSQPNVKTATESTKSAIWANVNVNSAGEVTNAQVKAHVLTSPVEITVSV